MALLWNISWMGAIICAFRVCGRSNTNQSVENWLGKCYWLDFNYCVQCVVVLTSFLSVGRNPKMPYFWLNVDPSAYSSGVSNSKLQILIVLSNTYNVLIRCFHESWILDLRFFSFFESLKGRFFSSEMLIYLIISRIQIS